MVIYQYTKFSGEICVWSGLIAWRPAERNWGGGRYCMAPFLLSASYVENGFYLFFRE
jgi:hypothetical protein